MKAIPMRAQLTVVAATYAAVLASAAVLVYDRYMQYVRHPQDVAASSGMYAAGDSMLAFFIACMLLVPTFLLVLVIRKLENLYTGYSKVLLGCSLTAPICLGLFSIPAVNQGTMVLGEISLERLFASPIVILGLGFSRLFARFNRAKRLTSYALLIEASTFVLTAGLFLFSARTHGS